MDYLHLIRVDVIDPFLGFAVHASVPYCTSVSSDTQLKRRTDVYLLSAIVIV